MLNKDMGIVEWELSKTENNKYAMIVNDRLVSFKTGDWHIDDTGVWKMAKKYNKTYKLELSSVPVIPTRIIHSVEDNHSLVCVNFKLRNREWREILVPVLRLSGKQRIINLSSWGIPVYSGNAKHFVNYFSDILYFNKLL